MSDLIAVAYPDRETAGAVRQKLAKLTLEHTIELEDAVVVDRDEDGRVRLHQAQNPVARCAAGGALWGGVIGRLFPCRNSECSWVRPPAGPQERWST